jgi:hypothetical protein
MASETSNPQKPLNFFLALAISAGIIVLWVIPNIMQVWYTGTSGTGIWGLLSIIAPFATILSPLAYGWYSRDEAGAILIGVIPLFLIMGISRIVFSSLPPGIECLAIAVLYTVSLCIAGGLVGFFAAKKTAGSFLIALILAGIWTGIFFAGIR